VAAHHAGAPLSVSTVELLNAGREAGGLDGGGNSDDPACFPATAPTNLGQLSADPSSACATAGLAPNRARVTDLSLLAVDADGNRRDFDGLAEGSATIAIGPDEPAR
jgi:hypothetical protein